MIADTTVLVDLLRGVVASRDRVAALEREGDSLRVPTPAVYELWEGVERSAHPARELFAVEELLRDFPVLAFELRHATRAGTVSGALARRGLSMDDIDLLIAGMALQEQEAVLTRNLKDFRRVPGLRVETY